jgi:DNA-binding NarL/FixJ family response regulator
MEMLDCQSLPDAWSVQRERTLIQPAPAMNANNNSSGQRKHRILIVDDHPIFRQGIGQVINHEADLVVCGEAETSHEALEAIQALKPDLVILDITLKGINGIELMKLIKLASPATRALVLSMHDESLYAERALRAGARGYVMKQEASSQVVTAIRKVLNGELYISPTMGSQMIRKVVEGASGTSRSAVETLSNRELEVLQLMGRGNGTRQIAAELKLSIKTIESHRAHIKEKLDFRTAPQMVRFAVEWVNKQVL